MMPRDENCLVIAPIAASCLVRDSPGDDYKTGALPIELLGRCAPARWGGREAVAKRTNGGLPGSPPAGGA